MDTDMDIEMVDAPPLDVEVELDVPMPTDPIDDLCAQFSSMSFSGVEPMDIDG